MYITVKKKKRIFIVHKTSSTKRDVRMFYLMKKFLKIDYGKLIKEKEETKHNTLERCLFRRGTREEKIVGSPPCDLLNNESLIIRGVSI